MNVKSETYFISNHDRIGFSSDSNYIHLYILKKSVDFCIIFIIVLNIIKTSS